MEDRIQKLDAEATAIKEGKPLGKATLAIKEGKPLGKATLSIKFFRGAKSRIWWKIEEGSKALSRSSTSYPTEAKARAVWEKVRKWVVEYSPELVGETEAYKTVEQMVYTFSRERDQAQAQVKELQAEIKGLNKTITAHRAEVDTGDAATSKLQAKVHSLESLMREDSSRLKNREGEVKLLTEQRDGARAEVRELQAQHKRALSSRMRRLFWFGG